MTRHPSEAVGRFRRQHKVDVVGHETIAVDGDVEPVALLAKHVEIGPLVVVYEKDSLAVIAAMGDMMRRAPGTITRAMRGMGLEHTRDGDGLLIAQNAGY